MTTTYDAIVVGGGIMGASTAYALLNKGERVLLIEQFEAGHEHGSSHGDGRVVRFNYAESIYVEMAKLGYPAWERLSQAAGQPLLQRTGLLEYGPADCVPMQESEAQLQQHQLEYEKLTPNEANRRFPQFRFADDTNILYQPEGAIAFATAAVLALWRLFRKNGGTAITGKRVTAIDIQGDAVSLSDSEGTTYTGRKLVVTAGAWTQQLLKMTGYELSLEVTQEVLAYFPPKDDSINHHIGTMPALVDYHGHLANPFYCLPIVDIAGVKMGWHHTGVRMQPDDERTVPDELLAGVRGWIARLFPHLQSEPLEIHMCLYTNSADYHFILDKHPQHEHIIIGAGFSGHGFKFGPIIGELLASLALNETLPISLETFSLARFDDPANIQRRVGA